MNIHEFNERVTERNRVENEQCDKWQFITTAYIALDLHKDNFCKIVDAVGWEQLENRHKHFGFVIEAVDEKRDRDNCVRIQTRLLEIDKEKKRLEAELLRIRQY